jgi:hypothetical protein
MERDAHGWNFAQEFFKKNFKNETFKVSDETIDGNKRSVHERTFFYEPLYVECTDYKTATDFMHHEVAKIIGVGWMGACGIPLILKRIVCATSFMERKICFEGRDIFQNIGMPDGPDPTRRYVMLRRGILMGDPLTKVLLHLVNICVRKAGRFFTSRFDPENVWKYVPRIDYGGAIYRTTSLPIHDTLNKAISRKSFLTGSPESVVRKEVLNQVIMHVSAKKSLNFNEEDEIPQPLQMVKVEEKPEEVYIPPRFPLPGVIYAHVDEQGVMGFCYVPKKYRNPQFLEITTVSLGADLTAKVEIPTAGRDPDNVHLEAEGLKPYNPYRRKLILTERDWLEIEQDHKARANPSAKVGKLARRTPPVVEPEGDPEDFGSCIHRNTLLNFVLGKW